MYYNCKFDVVDALRLTSSVSNTMIEDILKGWGILNFDIAQERCIGGKRTLEFEVFDPSTKNKYTLSVQDGITLVRKADGTFKKVPNDIFDFFYSTAPNQAFIPWTVDMTGIRKLIAYKGKDAKEEFEYAEKVHQQLCGNEDYINSDICVNRSCDRNDGTQYTMHCIVFDTSKSNPEITI